jgi:hypothetical protein
MEYCGTIRISNPKTLQSWIDRGWYQKAYLKDTYLWVAKIQNREVYRFSQN